MDAAGQTIGWLGPDGRPLVTGDGVIVGDSITAGGLTTSILTLPNIAEAQSGRYFCVNDVANVSQRIDVQGEYNYV